MPDNTPHRRRHVDTIRDDEKRRYNNDLIIQPGPAMPPALFPNDPDIRRLVGEIAGRLRRRLQRVIRDDKLEALHRLQPALERLARLDEVPERFVVACLDGQRGIVGRRVEKRRFRKVE